MLRFAGGDDALIAPVRDTGKAAMGKWPSRPCNPYRTRIEA